MTGRKWGTLETYGGKLTENIVQAIARDLLVYGMHQVARVGHRIVMHVHDEIVIENTTASDVLDDTIRLLDKTIYDTAGLETQQATLGERIEETITLMNQLITTAATTAHDPYGYDRRYHELEIEYQHLTDKIDNLRNRRAQAIEIRDYLATQPPLEYSDQAWNTLVDHAAITAGGAIDIQFKDSIKRVEKRTPKLDSRFRESNLEKSIC